MSKDGDTTPPVIDATATPAETPPAAPLPAEAPMETPAAAPDAPSTSHAATDPVAPIPASGEAPLSAAPEVPVLAPEPAKTPATPAVEDAVAAVENTSEATAETVAPAPAAEATQPEPAPAAVPVQAAATLAAAKAQRRRVPPLLAYSGWRLLELVATLAVATGLFAVLLPAAVSPDFGMLADRLAVTLPMIALCLVVAGFVGLPLGFAAGGWSGPVDLVVRGVGVMLVSVSPIWFGMLLILLFAATLGWLQPGGFVPWASNPMGALSSLVLPALALGLPLSGWLALSLRDSVRKALADPWLEAAQTMGQSRGVAVRSFVPRHALAATTRDLLVPLALLVPAGLVVENVFYLPGLGRLLLTALAERDHATLQAALVALVGLVAVCRLLGQVLRAAVDPRVPEGA